MINYGNKLANGENVKQNVNESLKYLKMAIDEGSDEAMCDFADLILRQGFCNERKDEAMSYLMKSIENGYTKSMILMGCLKMDENNENFNLDEAFMYIRMAANLGDKQAVLLLAQLCNDGDICSEEVENSHNKAINLVDSTRNTDNSSKCCILI